jgi:hypothetical protein
MREVKAEFHLFLTLALDGGGKKKNSGYCQELNYNSLFIQSLT